MNIKKQKENLLSELKEGVKLFTAENNKYNSKVDYIINYTTKDYIYIHMLYEGRIAKRNILLKKKHIILANFKDKRFITYNANNMGTIWFFNKKLRDNYIKILKDREEIRKCINEKIEKYMEKYNLDKNTVKDIIFEGHDLALEYYENEQGKIKDIVLINQRLKECK